MMEHVWTSGEDAIGQNMIVAMERTNFIVVGKCYYFQQTSHNHVITILVLPIAGVL